MTRPYILVGAGGTGSFLFPALLRYLESYHSNRDEQFTLTVIDGKEVGATKLHRQLFFGRHVGNPKATALLEQYEADPKVVIAVPQYLGDSNIAGIRDGSTIFIAADNYAVRGRIERHCLTLDNATVINGGNEMSDGSLQIWIRRDGGNVTPPLSQGHPEILTEDEDPSKLSCQQIAELPSGEQTIMANMMSATAMLNAIRKVHDWEHYNTTRSGASPAMSLPEEVFFDLNTFAMRAARRPEPA